jgi:hypothetical protein
MAKTYWYEYIFEDGYSCIVKGLSAQERRVEVAKHGKVVKVIIA